MKKSEIFRLAQLAVMHSEFIADDKKLEILRELFDREDFSRYVEEHEE